MLDPFSYILLVASPLCSICEKGSNIYLDIEVLFDVISPAVRSWSLVLSFSVLHAMSDEVDPTLKILCGWPNHVPIGVIHLSEMNNQRVGRLSM